MTLVGFGELGAEAAEVDWDLRCEERGRERSGEPGIGCNGFLVERMKRGRGVDSESDVGAETDWENMRGDAGTGGAG